MNLLAVRLVLVREFSVRVRHRGFLLSCLAMLAVLAMVALLPRLAGLNSFTVAWSGPAAHQVATEAAAQARLGRAHVHLREVPDEAAARTLVDRGKVTAAILGDGSRILVRREIPTNLRPYLLAAAESVGQDRLLLAKGIDPASIRPPPPVVLALQPVADGGETRRQEAFFVMFVMMGQVLGFGSALASGIVEEKSSRVVELLVSSIRPGELLLGKLLGITAVALLQLLVIGGAALGSGLAVGAVHPTAATFTLAGLVLPWFLLGLGLLASVYAAVGATVSRQEDLQSATNPISLLWTLSAVAGVIGLTQPDSPAMKVLSYVPLFSTTVMSERWAGGEATLPQVLVAMLVMLVVTGLVARRAARVFLTHLLRFGARVPLREALRAR